MRRRDALRRTLAAAAAAWLGTSREARAGALVSTVAHDPPRTLAMPLDQVRKFLAAPGAVAFDPSGKTVVAGMNSRGPVRAWEAETGREILTCRTGGGRVALIAVSPDGNRAAVAGPATTAIIPGNVGSAYREVGSVVEVWDLFRGRLIGKRENLDETGDMAQALAFGADGSEVLFVTSSSGLNRWSLKTDQVASWPFPGTEKGIRRHVHAGAFDARGTRAAAIIDPPGEAVLNVPHFLALWELPSGRGATLDLLDRLSKPYSPIAMSRDGRLVAFRVDLYNLAILDFHTGKTIRHIKNPPEPAPYLRGLEFSPDGTRLALAVELHGSDEPESVWVWDLTSGERLGTYPGPAGEVRAMTFLPDGRLRVVSGGGHRDGNEIPLKVWEADVPARF